MPELLAHVTENLILDGVPKSAHLCPIALALVDAGAEKVRVYTTLATFEYHGQPHQWNIPFSISLWIEKYDRQSTPAGPFDFSVMVPDGDDPPPRKDIHWNC